MVVLQGSSVLTTVFLVLALVAKQASNLVQKQASGSQSHGGYADNNDKSGPMLFSHSSNESLLRKKDGHMFYEEAEDFSDDENEEQMKYKTPASEKLKLESMSVFYSKGLYPTSLGMV